MKRIKLTALALPFLLTSAFSFAEDFKPTGFYLKGSYDDYIHDHHRNPPLYGVGLGYKFGVLRAEGKYGYGERFYGYTNAMSLLGYLDFDNSTFLSPYIGIGVEKNYNHLAQYVTYNDTHGLGTVGARAYLNQNIAIDVGYVTHLNSNLNQGRGSVGIVFQF